MTNGNGESIFDLIEHSVPYKTRNEPQETQIDNDVIVTESEAQESASWLKQVESKKKEAYSMINNTAKSVFDNQFKLQDYLIIQATFNRYSVRNALLVTAQRPSATQLHSYTEWNQSGYKIQQGVKGIMVLEPGNEYTRRDGSKGRYMNVRTLFDRSQVIGELPKSNAPDLNDKEVQRVMLSALIFNQEHILKLVKGDYENLVGERVAFYNNEVIYVDYYNSNFTSLYPTLAVELAHARCAKKFPEDYSRHQYGTVCEMVGFMICKKQGISWKSDIRLHDAYKDMSINEKIKLLDVTKGIFNDINSNIERGYKEEKKKSEKKE